MNLNSSQQKAVEHVEGPLLVLAGAGSGKTRVVVQRIIRLLNLGVAPQEILAVTFTNKAALEMKTRIQKLSNFNVLTSTFHSLCARILRESIEALGYKRDFTIYDEDDSFALLKNVFSELNIKDEKGTLRAVRNKIQIAKNDFLAPDKTTDEDEIFIKAYPLYQKKLKDFNAVDFDDLLFLTVTLLTSHANIREKYQNRWKFLLIDEYQDTNIAQYMIAKILAEKHKNIFVVGDPDQSIYSWRGAKYQNILNFDKDFPKAKIIALEHNYRSSNNILKSANHLIKNNPKRIEKNLFSTLGEGEKVKIYTAENEREEANFIIRSLLNHHEHENIPLEETVIFYRTNSQSRLFEDALLESKVPYVIYGGVSFYQRKEVKDILAFLRMVLSGADMIAFERTINLPKRGIGAASIDQLRAAAKAQNLSILDIILSDHLDKLKLSQNQRQNLRAYGRKIMELRQKKLSISELISEIIFSMNYLSYLKEDPETSEEREENLNALIAKAAEWQEQHEEPSIEKFLEELTLISSSESVDSNHAVKLMSLHNGKGLEFDLVFIAGMEEDLFPHINAKLNDGQIEEERRLCYVGITRAKKLLYLTHAKSRFLWGCSKFMERSRFLKELPQDTIVHLSKNKIELILEPEKKNQAFLAGDRISHFLFGRGTIKKVYNTSLGETYDIYFDNIRAMRTMVAKYAKLKSG